MPNVTRVEYRKDRKNLCVQYRERVWYTYEQVPEHVANAIRRAPSRGKAIWDLVRVRGTRYGHRYAYYKARGNECRENFLSRAAGALKRMAIAAGGAAWAVGGVMRGLGKKIAQKLKARKEAEAARQRREAEAVQRRAVEALQRELERASRRARIKIRHPEPRAPQPAARLLNLRRIFTSAAHYHHIPRKPLPNTWRQRLARLSRHLGLWLPWTLGPPRPSVSEPPVRPAPFRFFSIFSRMMEPTPTISYTRPVEPVRAVRVDFRLPTEFKFPDVKLGKLLFARQIGQLFPLAAGAVSAPGVRLSRVLPQLPSAALPPENIVTVDPLAETPSTVLLVFFEPQRVLDEPVWLDFLRRLPRWRHAVVAHHRGGLATVLLEMAPLAQTPEFVRRIDQLLESHPELLERFR